MTQTQLLGKIDFDADALQRELATIEKIPFSSAYAEFACGDWRSCVLYNTSGHSDDALIGDNQGKVAKTQVGDALPYIASLIEGCFDFQRLRYARLFRISNYGLIIPHRDFLELKEDYVRLHLVILTHDKSFSSDEDTVFQMREGEIWCLDATRVHSAAVLSDAPRIHLVLDFESGETVDGLLSPELRNQSLQPHIVERPAFDKAAEAGIMAMAGIVDVHTLPDLVSIITKHHFTHAIDAGKVHDVLIELCRRSGNEAAIQRAEALKAGCLLSRVEGDAIYVMAAE